MTATFLVRLGFGGYLWHPSRFQALRRPLKTRGLLILFTGSLLLLPGVAFGGLIPTTAGPTWGVDDWNTSTLNPSPVIQVSTIPGAQCAWINTGLDAFDLAHPGWSYAWASQTDMANVEQGISSLTIMLMWLRSQQ